MKKILLVLLCISGITMLIVSVSIQTFPQWLSAPGGILLLIGAALLAVLDTGGKVKDWLDLFSGKEKNETPIVQPTEFTYHHILHNNVDEPYNDDSKPSSIDWQARDKNLLSNYYLECEKYDASFTGITKIDEKEKVYLISSGLVRSYKNNIVLTNAGVLLCCNKEFLPRNTFHVHVKFLDKTI
jgi:hypothetical protein